MFIPHTESERKEMLAAVGVEKVEDLFAAIPEKHRFPKLGMLNGMTEMEASAQLKETFPFPMPSVSSVPAHITTIFRRPLTT